MWKAIYVLIVPVVGFLKTYTYALSLMISEISDSCFGSRATVKTWYARKNK